MQEKNVQVLKIAKHVKLVNTVNIAQKMVVNVEYANKLQINFTNFFSERKSIKIFINRQSQETKQQYEI